MIHSASSRLIHSSNSIRLHPIQFDFQHTHTIPYHSHTDDQTRPHHSTPDHTIPPLHDIHFIHFVPSIPDQTMPSLGPIAFRPFNGTFPRPTDRLIDRICRHRLDERECNRTCDDNQTAPQVSRETTASHQSNVPSEADTGRRRC